MMSGGDTVWGEELGHTTAGKQCLFISKQSCSIEIASYNELIIFPVTLWWKTPSAFRKWNLLND